MCNWVGADQLGASTFCGRSAWWDPIDLLHLLGCDGLLIDGSFLICITRFRPRPATKARAGQVMALRSLR